MTTTEPSFSAPAQTVEFNGLLFDMDGTIIVVKHWEKIGRQIGVDPEVILATSHGRRSIDVLRDLAPDLANWDYISHAEGLIPKEYGRDAIELPGARHLLEDLGQKKIPWCIVTSGTRPLVNGWLDVLGLAHPEFLVTAEDVQQGKPDPACYQMGARKLGLQGNDHSLIVFEDAPAGVRSGKAAGYKVVALHTTHTLEQLVSAGADYIIPSLSSVTLKSWDQATGKGRLQIVNALA